jgi:hypothetical protein
MYTGISLGYNCQPAIKGVQLGLRNIKQNGYMTCPFDECVTTYHGIIMCLQEDFKYLVDSTYLKIYESSDNIGGILKGEKVICNTRYNFIFNHESPGHANLYIDQNWGGGINHFVDNDFKLLKERYNNRINNFKNYLLNNNINFLITRYVDNITELELTIKNLYPNLNFKFTYFNTNESKESLIDHYKFIRMNDEDITKEFTVD